MNAEIKPRYQLENLPISDKTREGITSIDQIGAMGRMLSVQDDYTEQCLDKLAKDLAQVVTEQNELINKFIKEQCKLNLKFNARLDAHDKVMKKYELRLHKLECRTDELEKIIKELKGKSQE